MCGRSLLLVASPAVTDVGDGLPVRGKEGVRAPGLVALGVHKNVGPVHFKHNPGWGRAAVYHFTVPETGSDVLGGVVLLLLLRGRLTGRVGFTWMLLQWPPDTAPRPTSDSGLLGPTLPERVAARRDDVILLDGGDGGHTLSVRVVDPPLRPLLPLSSLPECGRRLPKGLPLLLLWGDVFGWSWARR